MRQLNVAGLNVKQILYGTSPYNSPVTGLPYEYRILDYYRTLDNVILGVKPIGTLLPGPQHNDFKIFPNINDVHWIHCQGF